MKTFKGAKTLNYAFLTLGCNVQKNKHIPFALKQLSQFADILRQTPLMITTPIDFPYPSDDFANIGFLLATPLAREQFQFFLKRLELFCGRSEANNLLHPELVPMDLDLIVWNGAITKAKDLKRGYVQDSLSYFNLNLTNWDDYISRLETDCIYL